MKMAEIKFYNSEGQIETLRVYCKEKVEKCNKELVKIDDGAIISIGERGLRTIIDVKVFDRELPSFEYKEIEDADYGETFKIIDGLILVRDKVFQLLDTKVALSADGYISFYNDSDSVTVPADNMSPVKRLEFVKFLISELPEKQRSIERGYL